jgi:hypothetical protein
MTGSAQVLLAGGGGAISGTAVLDDVHAGANAFASIALLATGAVSGVGTATVVPPRWYTPPSAPTLWATNTVDTGAPADAGSAGPQAPTSGNPTWGWTQATIATKLATCTLRIFADAAGTRPVATITYTVSARKANS